MRIIPIIDMNEELVDLIKKRAWYSVAYRNEKDYINMVDSSRVVLFRKENGEIGRYSYSLERSGEQRVDGFVRADKETGETKLVYWRTTMNHTGLSNGISVGDSYEKILTEY